MFSTILYLLLAIFTIVSAFVIYKKRRAASKKQSRWKRILHLLLFSFSVGLWLYQLCLWLIPNGNFVHETLRLPHHYVALQRVNVSQMTEERYPFGRDARQYLLYFEPKDGKVKQEGIVYFLHGGGWHTGSPELYRPVAQFFVNRGYAVVMPAYRLAPTHGYFEMREDLNLGMQKALAVLKSKNLQRRKFLLIGDSAGGNLAALLLYDRKNLSQIGISPSKFDCFIALAGALNLDEMANSIAVKDFAGSPMDSVFHLANPINYIQKNENTPVLSIHGTCDGYVNYSASETFVKKLNQIKPNLAQLVTIDDDTHLDVVGKWIYQKNATRMFLEKWLDKRELQVKN